MQKLDGDSGAVRKNLAEIAERDARMGRREEIRLQKQGGEPAGCGEGLWILSRDEVLKIAV